MLRAVRQLVENYWPRLEAEIGRFLADRSSPQGARTLVAIRSKWERIPPEEKQIAYLDNEVEFWFAVYSLNHLTGAPLDERVTSEYRENLEQSLRVSHEVLQRHTKLPPGLNARRPLPPRR
jgi:hypothetical protein